MVHPYRQIVSAVIFFSACVLGTLLYFRTTVVLELSIVILLLGYSLIVISCTSIGRTVLGDRSNKVPIFRWYSKLIASQIFLMLSTLAVVYAFFVGGPEHAFNSLSLDVAQKAVSKYTMTHWAFFPWGVYGLWALIIAYYAYVKKGAPYLYQTGNRLATKAQMILKAFVEFSSSTATLFGLSLVGTAVVLLFAYTIYAQVHMNHFMLPLLIVMPLSFLLPFFSLKWKERLLRRITKRNHTLNYVFFIFLLIVLPTLVGIAYFSKSLIILADSAFNLSKCDACNTVLNRIPVDKRLAMFWWGWLVIWTPLVGSFIASISQGRSIREFVVGMVSVSILSTFSLKLIISDRVILLLKETNFYGIAPLIMGAFLCWLLFMMLRGQRDNKLLISGYFPVPATLKRDRIKTNLASKVEGISKFGSNFLLIMTSLIMMHAIFGWYIIQLQLSFIGVFLSGTFFVACILFAIQLVSDNIAFGMNKMRTFPKS